jgi:diguanylate cyclase (GGDEF)-like protein
MQKILKEFRLIAAVGLLLIPIILLGWLFIAHSNEEITFANREIEGLDYLIAVLPIHASLANGSRAISTTKMSNFAKARVKYDHEMNLAGEAAELQSALSLPILTTQQKLLVSTHFITAIADKSNLILDPDLDTYYLMDIAVIRLPEVMTLAAKLTGLARDSNNSVESQENQIKFILAVESLKANFGTIQVALAKATQNTATAVLSKKLVDASSRNSAIGYATAAASFNVKQLSLNNKSDNRLVDSSYEQWQAVANDLGQLLKVRSATSKTRFLIAIGISAFVTLIALMLAFTVLRKLLVKLDDRIVFLAHHDPMTQLKNRASFSTDMAIALREADRSGEVLALHVIDCDNFKSINDTHGHQAGDVVLQHVAKCLQNNTRKSDLVGRLGGDEFVILQRNVSAIGEAQILADRIVATMREPIAFGQTHIFTSVTIGLAHYPHHSHETEALMTCSDTTLYAAKAAGRNRAMTYSRDMEVAITKRRELEQEVLNAVAEHRLFLHFQPQFDTAGKTLRGFEALLRLKSSKGEIIPPNTFIPIAESMGLINEYGTWVLENAARVASNWPDHVSLAVNLSPLQFKSASISQTIRIALDSAGLAAKRLQVEITEGILLEESQSVLDELRLIRAMGVAIAMDDFGTGFSSLSYLWRFRFDKIKIDRSFMLALDNDRESAENILKTIVMLGHSLAMEVTAEGVETSQQADLMGRLNCDEIQGFLYGRPLPEQDLAGVILKSFQRSTTPAESTSHSHHAVKA